MKARVGRGCFLESRIVFCPLLPGTKVLTSQGWFWRRHEGEEEGTWSPWWCVHSLVGTGSRAMSVRCQQHGGTAETGSCSPALTVPLLPGTLTWPSCWLLYTVAVDHVGF